jgi:hypothetical protein
MYYPNHFNIWELVPPSLGKMVESRGVYQTFNILFDERLLRTMDMLRNEFGTMQVNTWKNGGVFEYRGFRPSGCDIGARLSQHRFGRAVDMIPLDSDVEHIREEILNRPNSVSYQYIGGLELDVSWLHIDVRGRLYADKIATFTP